MKKFLGISLLLIAATVTGCAKVPPGYSGIKINQIGSGKGVSKENVVVGTTFFVPGIQQVIVYPTFMQTVTFTESKEEGNPTNEEFSFNTRDQIRVDMDVSLNYTVDAALLPEFYTKFRADKIERFTHTFLRNIARNSVCRIGGEYSFDALNGEKKEEFLRRIEADINKVLQPYGVTVAQFSSIGPLRPPEAISNAVINKTKSIQDAITAENQLREIRAEAAKKVAAAEGEAAANRAKVLSITPQLIELRKLEIEEKRIAKWKGDYPSTVVTSGGSGTLLNLGLR